MSRSFSHLLALVVALVTSLQVFGQNLEREPLNTSGTLKGVAPGVIQIATGEGDLWLLKVEARQQDVTFSGTAEKTFLRPGMFIEFRAQVNKRGAVLEPVASLTVFTPSDARPPGIQEDGAADADAKALFGEGNDEKKEAKKPDPKEKKAAKAKVDDTVYRVAGAISKVGRVGDVTVSAGGAQVKFNLAEDCKITVDTNDLLFVSPGDKVTVRGWYYKGRPGEGVASTVEVIAAIPLTDGSKKKPTKPVKGDPKAEKGAKGEKPAEEKKDGDKKETEKNESKKEE